jgi:hypothetical protein
MDLPTIGPIEQKQSVAVPGPANERTVQLNVSCTLPSPVERAWEALRRPRLLQHVASPVLAFAPIQPPEWPEVWTEGAYLVELRLFGRLPLGRQWIVISFPEVSLGDPGLTFRVRDAGRGQIARRWDHLVTITALPEGRTRYEDRVDIDAGILTPLVWLFAHLFYRYRQARWRRLARANFAGFASRGTWDDDSNDNTGPLSIPG